MIFYKCDKTKCNDCESDIRNSGLCDHTSNIDYAKNFVKVPDGNYWEQEPEPIYLPEPVENEPVTWGIIGGFIVGAIAGGLLF